MASLFFFTLVIAAAALVAASSRPSTCLVNLQRPNTNINGSVDMAGNPLTHFDAAMLPLFNSTAGEDWSFDAVSEDGQAAMGLTFSRGTVAGHPLAQRMFFAVVWPNGTRYMESTFAEVSTIQSCKHSTIGTWYNGTSGLNWTFEASKDFSHTHVTVDSPTVKGTYSLKSLAPAVYPNGLQYPNSRGDTLFAPYLYWEESVPVGMMQANLTIRGTPFIYKGMSGRERNWNSFGWADISARWDQARAVVGPFTLIAWIYDSKVDRQTYFSSVLMKDRRVIFRTQSQQKSNSSAYGSFIQTNTGTVHLASEATAVRQLPQSNFTGYALEMINPKTREHWKFEVEFTKCVYWFQAGTSAIIGGHGGTVNGGKVGGKQYTGLASGTAQQVN
ncbi:hypothetical protein B0J14DRAFT_193262 [Halenospora varia]|nr:hypothetical protein B0J14DRAFT_193262 [Halenospora varia]